MNNPTSKAQKAYAQILVILENGMSGLKDNLKVDDLVRHNLYGLGRVLYFDVIGDVVHVKYPTCVGFHYISKCIPNRTIKRVGRIKNLKKK